MFDMRLLCRHASAVFAGQHSLSSTSSLPLIPSSTLPIVQECCAHPVACPCLNVHDLRLDWQDLQLGQQVRSSKGRRCGGAPNPTRENPFRSRRSWWKRRNLLPSRVLRGALTAPLLEPTHTATCPSKNFTS